MGLAYSSTLLVSIVASAAAAVIPRLQGFSDPIYPKNLTSILAGLAAVLISLSTAGGFGKRWRACRLSRSKVRELKNEHIGRDATRGDIDRLNQIDEEHNAAITST